MTKREERALRIKRMLREAEMLKMESTRLGRKIAEANQQREAA